MFKHLILPYLFIVNTSVSIGQYNNNHDFLVKKQQIGRSGMIVYTSWSSANLAGGIACWAGMKGEGMYFGQMNTIWSVVNLGIAIPGLLGSFKKVPSDMPTGKLIQQQYRIEATYLINGGLDFLYLGTGAVLRSLANRYPSNENRLLGYGDAFLINGGFLLFFDFIQYLRHRHQRTSANNLFLDRLSMSDTGIGLKYTFK